MIMTYPSVKLTCLSITLMYSRIILTHPTITPKLPQHHPKTYLIYPR